MKSPPKTDALSSAATTHGGEINAFQRELLQQIERQAGDIGELRSSIAALKSDNVKIKSDNAKFKSDNAKLKSDNAKLKSDNTELKSSIAELKSDNAELKSTDTKHESSIAELKLFNAELSTTLNHVSHSPSSVMSIVQLAHSIQKFSVQFSAAWFLTMLVKNL